MVSQQSVTPSTKDPQQMAGQVAEQLQQQASQVMGQARDQAMSEIESQKEKAAEGLGSVAEALRQTSQGLRKNDADQIANFVDQAADQVERFSDQLSRRDVDELMMDVERFARSQPLLFVSGAFALGLAAARFLKSSSSASRSYGGPSYGTAPSDRFENGSGGRSGYGYWSRNQSGYGSGSPSSPGYGRVQPERVDGGVTGAPGSSRTPRYTQRNPQAMTADPDAYEPSTRTSHLTGHEEK